MASLSEVQTSLQAVVAGCLYPDGESNPSVTGGSKDIYIAQGWPQPDLVERLMPLSQSVVSIFTPPHNERNVTRFLDGWRDKSINDTSLTLITNGQTLTIGGTPNIGEIVVVLLNYDNFNTYSHTVINGDTTSTIASALAVLIPGATVLANVITISNVFNIIGRVSVQGTRIKEGKRQERIFWLVVWAFTPTLRDTISNAIDLKIAFTPYISLPNDIEQARLIYKDMCEYDYLVKQQCYRRDFYVHIEYPTTKIETDYTLEAINTPITVSPV